MIKNDKYIFLVRLFIVCSCYLYIIESVIYILFVYTYIDQIFRLEEAAAAYYKLIDSLLFLINSILMYVFFKVSLKTFDKWRIKDVSFNLNLESIAKISFSLFFIDLVSLGFSLLFKISYEPPTKNFNDDSVGILQIVNFIYLHSGDLSQISHFLDPKPPGIIFLFLGVFILVLKKEQDIMVKKINL